MRQGAEVEVEDSFDIGRSRLPNILQCLRCSGLSGQDACSIGGLVRWRVKEAWLSHSSVDEDVQGTKPGI